MTGSTPGPPSSPPIPSISWTTPQQPTIELKRICLLMKDFFIIGSGELGKVLLHLGSEYLFFLGKLNVYILVGLL